MDHKHHINPVYKVFFYPLILIDEIVFSQQSFIKKMLSLIIPTILLLIWGIVWTILVGLGTSLFGISFYEPILKLVSMVTIIWALFFIVIPIFKKQKQLNIVYALALGFILLLFVNGFILGTNVIDGLSMEPTISNGQQIIVKKIANNYNRGDLIIFKSPRNTDVKYLSRIIATEGDSFSIKEGKVYLNNLPLQEEYSKGITYLSDEDFIKENNPIIIPKNNILVLSDNRQSAIDSRNYGLIPKSSIVGKIIYFFGNTKNSSKVDKKEEAQNLLSVGKYFYTLGNSSEAKSYFNKTIEINKNNSEAYILLGDIYYQEKDYDTALKYFNEGLVLDKDNPLALALSGDIYGLKGNIPKAKTLYQKALVEYKNRGLNEEYEQLKKFLKDNDLEN